MYRLALSAALGLSLLAGGAPGVGAARGVPLAPPVVRLHIVANSNRPEDIAAKLAVRDALWGYLQSRLANARSAQQAERDLRGMLPAIRRIANRTLTGYGIGYRAEVALGSAALPPRQYLGARLPAGRYVTLLVRLGAAKGQNWWCTLFPQLCFADQNAALDYSEGRALSPTGFIALGRGAQPSLSVPVRPGGLIWSFWQLFHSERGVRGVR